MNRHELETRAYVERFEAPKRCQSHRRTLEVLADLMRMRHDGRTPAIAHARLGHMVGLHERQTQNVIHALERAGVLRIVRRSGFANVYRVLVDWVLRLIAGESVVELESAALDPSGTVDLTHSTTPPTRPPPRTDTLDRAAVADYWRTVNANRW